MKSTKLLVKLSIAVFSFLCISVFVFSEENRPQRMVSLGPSITEQLYLLGVQDKLIGCTTYCKRPPEAETKQKVGTAIEANLEKVVSLEPDLVLVTSLTDAKAIEKLRSLKIGVVSFPQPKSFVRLCEQFLKLGEIVGRKKEAEKIIRIVKDQVDFIREQVRDLQKPKVFVQIGARPLFTVTGDSFINDFIELAGGINITKNLSSGLCSREKVLKSDPDVIIIVTMGIAGEKEVETWGKYKVLKAVKNNRIYIVDSYKLCSPTPESFVRILREIVSILHSERKDT